MSEGAPETYRYAAFISYRHVEPDRKWAHWLHAALEGYRVPKGLCREQGLPSRLGRVFRDEEELAAAGDLSLELKRALDDSAHLIVVCSPAAAASTWVDREVRHFARRGREHEVLPLLVEGDPDSAFPEALREVGAKLRSARDAQETSEDSSPLAADVRRATGSSSRRRREALLRLVAPLLGVRFDDLVRREEARRRRRRWTLAAGGTALLLVVGTLGWLYTGSVETVGRLGAQTGHLGQRLKEETQARSASEVKAAQEAARAAEALAAQSEAEAKADRAREAQRSVERRRADEAAWTLAEQGRGALARSDRRAALNALLEAHRLRPDDAGLQVLLGKALEHLGGLVVAARAPPGRGFLARFLPDGKGVIVATMLPDLSVRRSVIGFPRGEAHPNALRLLDEGARHAFSDTGDVVVAVREAPDGGKPTAVVVRTGDGTEVPLPVPVPGAGWGPLAVARGGEEVLSSDGARTVVLSPGASALREVPGSWEGGWFDPAGRRVLLAGSLAGEAALLVVGEERPRWSVKLGGRGTAEAAFAPSKDRAVLRRADRAWLLDLADGRVLADAPSSALGDGAPRFSGDGRYVLWADGDQTRRVLDAAEGKPVRTLPEESRNARAWAVRPHAATFASFHQDGSVRLWDGADPARDRVLDPPPAEGGTLPTAVGSEHAFDGKGRRLLSVLEDGTVSLLDMEAGPPRALVTRVPAEVEAACLSEDGTHFATVHAGGLVCLWDAAAARTDRALRLSTPMVEGLGVDAESRRLLVRNAVGESAFLDLADGRVSAHYRTSIPHAVLFLAPGARRALALPFDPEAAAVVFDPENGTELARFEPRRPGGPAEPRLLAPFAAWAWPDRARVLFCGLDGAWAWDFGDAPTSHWLVERGTAVIDAVFDGAGERAVLVHRDGRASVHEAGAAGSTPRAWPLEGGRSSAAALSPDGTRLAWVAADGAIRWQEVGGAKPPRVLPSPPRRVGGLLFAGDGGALLAFADGFTLVRWDLERGDEPRTSQAHAETVEDAELTRRAGSPPRAPSTVALSPDGALLAVGDTRGGVGLWSAEGPREAWRHESPGGRVERLLWTDDATLWAVTLGGVVVRLPVSRERRSPDVLRAALEGFAGGR